MNRIKRTMIYSIFVLAFFMAFSSCINESQKTPVLADRTIGWEPKVLYTDLYDLLIDTNDPFFQSFLFEGSKITSENPVYIDTSDDISVIMECALKAAFDESYIDNGSETPVIKRRDNYLDYYTIELLLGGETCVMIDSATGRVVQCIDTRIQNQFRSTTEEMLKKGLAYITSDLAVLSEQEVEQLSRYSNDFSETHIPHYFIDKQKCPVDAVEAFEATSTILCNAYSSGRWKHIGDGEYVIYDADNSNSWLIIGKNFTLLLDKDTGEKKFFSVWKEGFLDQSCRCQG